jgi:hypothetical protein
MRATHSHQSFGIAPKLTTGEALVHLSGLRFECYALPAQAVDTRLCKTENVFAAADDLAAASFLPRTSITATSRTATSGLHVAGHDVIADGRPRPRRRTTRR